jgi:sulfur relay (sulfurtransferase) complex TusBCD TusD component (DsrE family)
MSDAVMCAANGQTVKQGYNISVMLQEILNAGGVVKICTSCAETRGLQEPIKGTELGTLIDLTNAIVEYDRVLTF